MTFISKPKDMVHFCTGVSFLLFYFILTLCVSSVVSGAAPAGYYDSVNTANASTLRTTLHDVIDDHVRFPYTSSATDTWDILEAADEDPGNSGRIIDVYKNASYAKVGGGNSNYNREHTWPKSYGFPKDNSGNYPYTDCHHLFLTNSGYNSSRGNKPYRDGSASSSEKTTLFNDGRGGGSGTYSGNSNWTSGSGYTGTWQTWDGRKGDVARALMYLDVRYEGGTHGVTGKSEPDLILTNDQNLINASNTGSNTFGANYMGILDTLIEWHEDDPTDSREQFRNDVIFIYQENRNPFIDHPEWVTTLFGSAGNPAPPPGATPWINEIHYDNSSSDVNEAVEIAGTSGTSLSGYKVIGYNGNGGGTYKTVNLSGTIPNQQAGLGTLNFSFSSMQNGAPDGLALVDDTGTVLEFISYEGSFTATNGDANGMTSVSIGVKETSSTPAGNSLQLGGTGSERSDFTWQTHRAHTRGLKNSGQTFQ